MSPQGPLQSMYGRPPACYARPNRNPATHQICREGNLGSGAAAARPVRAAQRGFPHPGKAPSVGVHRKTASARLMPSTEATRVVQRAALRPAGAWSNNCGTSPPNRLSSYLGAATTRVEWGSDLGDGLGDRHVLAGGPASGARRSHPHVVLCRPPELSRRIGEAVGGRGLPSPLSPRLLFILSKVRSRRLAGPLLDGGPCRLRLPASGGRGRPCATEASCLPSNSREVADHPIHPPGSDSSRPSMPLLCGDLQVRAVYALALKLSAPVT